MWEEGDHIPRQILNILGKIWNTIDHIHLQTIYIILLNLRQSNKISILCTSPTDLRIYQCLQWKLMEHVTQSVMLEMFTSFFIPVPKEEVGFSLFRIKIFQKHFIQCNESIFYLYLWEKPFSTDCTRNNEFKLFIRNMKLLLLKVLMVHYWNTFMEFIVTLLRNWQGGHILAKIKFPVFSLSFPCVT